jgi:hypothetical protein
VDRRLRPDEGFIRGRAFLGSESTKKDKFLGTRSVTSPCVPPYEWLFRPGEDRLFEEPHLVSSFKGTPEGSKQTITGDSYQSPGAEG